MKHLIVEKLSQSVEALRKTMANDALLTSLTEASQAVSAAMLTGRKLMIAGNGGSAADAQHLAAEFVSRLTVDRPAMRAIALTTDSSILTAISNDYGYANVFSRQLEAIGQRGDVFLAISTSGSSKNVLRALSLCRKMGIATIGFCGQTGGQMAPLCDYCIKVPSKVTAQIQEVHLALEHIFCHLVETHYFCTEFLAGQDWRLQDPQQAAARPLQ